MTKALRVKGLAVNSSLKLLVHATWHKLTATEWCVLVYLAAHPDNRIADWPGFLRLKSLEAGYSPTGLRRGLRGLFDRGWVELSFGANDSQGRFRKRDVKSATLLPMCLLGDAPESEAA